MEYDFVNNMYTIYEPVETPKVKLNLPIINDDSDLDISSWASKLTSSGTPVAKGIDDIKFNTTPSQPATYQTLTLNEGSPENAKRAYNFFINKGLKPHQAAGIVGSLSGESGENLNPSAINSTSGAFGTAQWLGSRKKKLMSKYGNKPTLDQQLEFIWEELNTSEKKALDHLKNTSTVQDATRSFTENFERPSRKEIDSSIKQRTNFALSLLV